MNAKMLELYKQAQVPCTAIDPSNNMPYETTCFSADKFSELIVLECAKMCHNQALVESERGTQHSYYKERALDAIGVEMTNYFGVKYETV